MNEKKGNQGPSGAVKLLSLLENQKEIKFTQIKNLEENGKIQLSPGEDVTSVLLDAVFAGSAIVDHIGKRFLWRIDNA